MRTRAPARIFSLVRSRLVCWCMCTASRIRTPTCIFACVPLYDSRDRYMQRSSPLSFSFILPLFPSHSFVPPFPLDRSFFLFRSHPCAFSPSVPLLFPASRPPPLSTPSRIFYSFFLSFSLSISLFRVRSLSSYAYVSLYSVPSLSVSPKLLPLSLATAYTVEAAQAAEGHRSQLWTYLDRQARSEVWTSFAPASLSSVLSPRGPTVPMRRR